MKLVGVYISLIYTPTSFILHLYTSFFTRGIHEFYTPAIKQSDWLECTNHGTIIHRQ